MSWLDIAIVVIIGLSALISLVRGFVKESISLVSWILAGVVALRYFSALAGLLEAYVANEMLRNMAAFGVLFVVTLVIGAIINFMMSQLVSKTGLSGTDKALGVVFGAARGVLIVTMLVLLASQTPMPSADWWQDSLAVGYFVQMAEWIAAIIPDDVASNFNFN